MNTMRVEVNLHDGPLDAPEPWQPDGAGACIAFEGVVRPMETGRPLAALVYQAYEPMTSRELHQLGQAIVLRHDLIALAVITASARCRWGRCRSGCAWPRLIGPRHWPR